MSLLGSLFSGNTSESSSNINWFKLTDLNDLESMIQESFQHPVVVFKHSTRCSISRMALRQFEADWNLEGKITPYFLDLLEYRPISNAIAERLGVVHQSPQVIVIKDGQAVYDASHEGIAVVALAPFG
ncbi:bacillithiol system redox-active protein YtxJ [Flavobacterium sp.]|uniref:bacillithiol system redox-active protein YtxJ n=1 Tax=Flavobacterium sp. TaxID=239 RepID=UPI0022C2BE3D|nr:bacillithiol system redox-active protein YtxJ [Flavobacterium sp.]MCZ8146014.1 bacillithiol system redox-active protein YtxJ [Flavobacterium sp.]MCZ8367233.1 bacillithiol system redox-active protein YtxJ [Flavobacterium sp.]